MKLTPIEKKVIRNKVIQYMNDCNSKGENNKYCEADGIRRIEYSKMFKTNGFYCVSFFTYLEDTYSDVYIDINEYNLEVNGIVTSTIRNKKLKDLLGK